MWHGWWRCERCELTILFDILYLILLLFITDINTFQYVLRALLQPFASSKVNSRWRGRTEYSNMVSPRPSVATRLPCDFWKHVTVRACHDISWPGMCPSSGYSNLLCTGKLYQKVTACYDKWMDRLASPTACLCRGRKGQDLLAAYLFALPCMWILGTVWLLIVPYGSYSSTFWEFMILQAFFICSLPTMLFGISWGIFKLYGKSHSNQCMALDGFKLATSLPERYRPTYRCNLGCNTMLIYEQSWATDFVWRRL